MVLVKRERERGGGVGENGEWRILAPLENLFCYLPTSLSSVSV